MFEKNATKYGFSMRVHVVLSSKTNEILYIASIAMFCSILVVLNWTCRAEVGKLDFHGRLRVGA